MSKIDENKSIYIKFTSVNPGGVGHALIDYLTPYILGKNLNLKFIHSPLIVGIQQRDMDLNVNQNELFWNDFLNLDLLSNNMLPKNYKTINITGEQYKGYSLKKFENMINEKVNKSNNICISIFPIQPRLHLYDLYNMEFQGLVKKGITMSIINDLRNVFFKKHSHSKNNCFTINIYVRQGDIGSRGMNFEYNIFKIINKLLVDKKLYKINLISAGTSKQMNDIRKIFSEFENINFILNAPQGEVFKLMVLSDMLIYNFTSFAFIASIYCSGTIITAKKNGYTSPYYFYEDEKFLDNYILINPDETENEYLTKMVQKSLLSQ